MKYLLLALLCSFECAFAQNNVLHVGVMGHSGNNLDAKKAITQFFQQMIGEIKRMTPDFPYDKAEYLDISYSTSSDDIGEDAIVTLTPLKYVLFQHQNSLSLIPLFVTKKRGEHTAYYPSIFIANKESSINSIADQGIKRIYLIKNSASGYLAPLNKLFEANIISEPTEIGVRKHGWEPVLCNSHSHLMNAILRDKDAIGATWNVDGWDNGSKLKTRILLRFDCFPQDPLVISANLKKYQGQIARWFSNAFNSDTLTRQNYFAAANITGMEPYTQEYENGFQDMYAKYNKMIHFHEDRNFTRILTALIMLCTLLAFSVVAFSNKAVKAALDSRRRKAYSSLAWGGLTAFILVAIETVRFVVEKYAHEYSVSIHDNARLFIIVVGVLLASLSEFKIQFARFIGIVVKRIIHYLQPIPEVINPPGGAK